MNKSTKCVELLIVRWYESDRLSQRCERNRTHRVRESINNLKRCLCIHKLWPMCAFNVNVSDFVMNFSLMLNGFCCRIHTRIRDRWTLAPFQCNGHCFCFRIERGQSIYGFFCAFVQVIRSVYSRYPISGLSQCYPGQRNKQQWMFRSNRKLYLSDET